MSPRASGGSPGGSKPRGSRTDRPVLRLAAPPTSRPTEPLSQLVLVDQYAAQGSRVRHDELLDKLFEERCDWVREYGRADQLAVDSAELRLTYGQLDARANQTARYLRLHGASAGDRIALLFDRPADAYVAMLAVLKIGATYVPLDVSCPPDRMSYILADAGVRTVLTTSQVAQRLDRAALPARSRAELLPLDRAAPLINEQNPRRLVDAERGPRANRTAYVLYQPGPDGRPLGVAVDHLSICNFVRVASDVFAIRPRDRVYQSLSLAFDLAIQEIWLPWFCGATVVAKPAGVVLAGRELHAFLAQRRVTAMCTVPGVLATLPADLPGLRFLLLAGEACPTELIARWHRPGRRLLSSYGPSEAVVSATWSELRPDKPVTLGVPLPTYNTVILDVEDPYHALPHGELGEIGIAGIGLAAGYLNRDDLTDEAFIPDFLEIPGNPSGCIYRTGDLGRVNADGEIEYHGRLDPATSTRGYRRELVEIESALLGGPRLAPAAYAPAPPAPPQAPAAYAPAPPAPPREPAASGPAASGPAASDTAASVPAYAPARPSPPAGPEQAPGAAPLGTAPRAAVDVERALAMLLADVLGARQVAADAHFFADLGADWVLAARFCARAAKRADLPRVSIKQVYAHPTLRELTTALLAPSAPPATPPAPPRPAEAPGTAPPAPAKPVAAATEAALATVLADVLGLPSVPTDGHFFEDLGADSMLMARFCARARQHPDLPAISIKDIYAHPSVHQLATALAGPAPVAAPAGTAQTEAAIASVLGEVLDTKDIPSDGHFFDDLGADSMLMARFCARARQHPDLPAISIKDVYAHPSVRALAAFVAPTPLADADGAGGSDAGSGHSEYHVVDARQWLPPPVGRPRHALCGTLQLLFFIGYAYAAAYAMHRAYTWISASPDVVTVYLRSAIFGAAGFVSMCLIPIVAKWLLIGRWKPQQIRVWSLAYLRFWVVRALIRSNPLVRFAGSPLYVLYLRALGAKIGRGVTILSARVPVCTDLLTIGEGTLIRKESFFTCYRAQAGLIQTGPVSLGRDVFVGEQTVLDIGSAMGDGSQLGHSSSVHTGQVVPAGEHWHGSPSERTTVNYRIPGFASRLRLRRALYPTLQLVNLLLVALPVSVGAVIMLLVKVPQLAALLTVEAAAFRTWTFYAYTLAGSFVLFFGSLLLSLLVMMTFPRLLNLFIKPNKEYRLFGLRYWAHRTITRTTNSKFFARLFGDSSYVVGYLLGLGYRLRPVVQTGSNFANEVKHETPFLVSVGQGTVVASGISIANADFSATSFRVGEAAIGGQSFLGNDILYPAGGKAGDNCLLATKVMVPIEGPVRQGVGLLGSPSFEIPRSVQRDSQFDHLTTGEALRRGLAAKNRYNLATIGWLLFARWMQLFLFLVIALLAVDFYDTHGTLAITLANVAILVVRIAVGVLVERAGRRFRPLRPTYCSIYHRDFWRQERFFKLAIQIPPFLNGTPFRPLILRLVGVRMGRRVFDDGVSMSEKNLVTIGDYATLNDGSVTQCHSQEDNAFKSDQITIGPGCTVGTAAFVHYGVTMGAGSVLEPDSFLMKGEEIPEGEWWGGNPASQLRHSVPALPQHDPVPGTALVHVQ